MKDINNNQWQEDNRNYLLACLERILTAIKRNAGLPGETTENTDTRVQQDQPVDEAGVPPALETLCSIFNLTTFERDILLLCAGMELDQELPGLCAALHNDPHLAYPTFSLAMRVLDNAHWDAFSPAGPLRYWKLIEVGGGVELIRCPLRIDEKILHYLVGVDDPDQRLDPLLEPLHTAEALSPSQYAAAEQMAAIWRRTGPGRTPPVFLLYGGQVDGKRAAAAAVAQLVGLDIKIMPAYLLPTSPEDLDSLIRLWEREAALGGRILLLDCDEVEPGDPARDRSVNHLVECIKGLMMVTCRQRRRPPRRPFLGFDVEKPTAQEQQALWRRALGKQAKGLAPWIERLVFQFNLGPSAIDSVCLAALSGQFTPAGQENVQDAEKLGAALWENCRFQARPRLENLVQRIEPKAGWDDLVLPRTQLQVLRDIVMQVRHRARVYDTWEFAGKGTRGTGISALFSGASGTGKTLAAEVLAKELKLDLYRIDLSTVVNKYIGETEKNLRRVFDMAEEAGAILLFDEADALFGKRSDVKDSHDRHANIEVSYLLQRMEAYRGLAILTTNLKDSLDKAFMRRLRFIVHFPFPGPGERVLIWQNIFPVKMPTRGLDFNKLARLNMSGGNIRGIALNAAFLAAEEEKPVTMVHLLQAARQEYTKLEKTLTWEETKGWI
jgi:hypothetical protein